jgi:hypothetical protein
VRAERRTRRALLAAFVGVAIVPIAHADAASHPHVVVWSGGLGPKDTAIGVELRTDGSGQRLRTDADGKVYRVGSFAPRGAKLAAIRSAAEQVLVHAPFVTRAPNTLDGSYATVAVAAGARHKLVLDENADPAAVVTLIARLDAALPRSSRVSIAGGATARSASAGPIARIATRSAPPTVGDCANAGHHATDVKKYVSLEDAAREGVVTDVRSKGPAGGDALAVDAKSKDIAAPTDITIHAEVSTNIPGADVGALTRTITALANAEQNQYDVDGQPVNIHYDFQPRAAGAAPSNCVHQILVTNDTNADGSPTRAVVFGSSDAQGNVTRGDKAMVIPRAGFNGLPHEFGHFMEFGDQYTDSWVPNKGGDPIPLPSTGLEGEALQAALPPGVDASEGRVVSVPREDGDAEFGDVMRYAAPGNHYSQADLNGLLAKADIHVHADPGTVVIDKTIGSQNFGVGAPFDLDVPNGGFAHTDGIVAYCLDLLGHETPGVGTNTFDVLPKAGELGGEAMDALQRVLDVIAARQPGPLEETPGANAAVWRVTDDLAIEPDGDPDTVAILQAAGIPLDPAKKTFTAPHFDDPAAAIPYPVALASPTGAPLPPSPPPPPLPFTLPQGSSSSRCASPHGASPRRAVGDRPASSSRT